MILTETQKRGIEIINHLVSQGKINFKEAIELVEIIYDLTPNQTLIPTPEPFKINEPSPYGPYTAPWTDPYGPPTGPSTIPNPNPTSPIITLCNTNDTSREIIFDYSTTC